MEKLRRGHCHKIQETFSFFRGGGGGRKKKNLKLSWQKSEQKCVEIRIYFFEIHLVISENVSLAVIIFLASEILGNSHTYYVYIFSEANKRKEGKR